MGENLSNPWSDTGRHKNGSVAVMIDNFAIPAATIRGLFDYEYEYDRIILRPRIPGSISEYSQKVPVRFGNKKLFVSCINGGSKIKRVEVNGKALKVNSKSEVELLFKELPNDATVVITTTGGWPVENVHIDYPVGPALVSNRTKEELSVSEMPQSLQKSFSVLLRMKEKLADESNADYEKAFVDVAIESCKAYLQRTMLEPGPGYFRPITNERIKDINQFYEMAALSMVKGFDLQMKDYVETGNARQKRIAKLYHNIEK